MQTTSEKAIVTQMPVHVSALQTDMHGRMRLGAFASALIEAAIQSAEHLGFGFNSLKQSKLFWVLSRLSIKFEQVPKWHDKLVVETWPKGSQKILYFRDFVVRNQFGEIVANATSAWLAIDINNKRPQKLAGVDEPLFFDALKDRHAIETPPVRLGAVLEGDTFMVKSSYFDADVNGHVTSSRYVDWIMDTFDLDLHENNYPKGFSINFLKETMPGEDVQFMRLQKSGGEYYFEGQHQSTSSSAVRAAVKF